MKWLNRKALLYTRVSSDDQKNNNSLSDQLDRLQTFCRVMKIEVVQVYTDDGFSARSFDRPAFGQILSNSKANRKAANLLLFTNWSRNGNRIEPSTILPLLHFIQKLAA